MKPAPFSYHVPSTVREAVSMLAEFQDDGRVLAGGQSLIPLMNFRLAQPAHLIDINPLSELDYIRRDDWWPIHRFATGAPSGAASPTPTRPPSCPRWPWPWAARWSPPAPGAPAP
jgi:hypothetical protein